MSLYSDWHFVYSIYKLRRDGSRLSSNTSFHWIILLFKAHCIGWWCRLHHYYCKGCAVALRTQECIYALPSFQLQLHSCDIRWFLLKYLVWWQWHPISGIRRLLQKGSNEPESHCRITIFCSIWELELAIWDWVSSILQALKSLSKCQVGHAQSELSTGGVIVNKGTFMTNQGNVHDRPKNA